MLDGRLYHHVDWPLIAAILMLCAIGVAMIYSTTFEPTVSAVGPQFGMQFYALLLGGVVFAVCLGVDYRVIADYALLIYGGVLVALVVVLLFGEISGGSQRWLRIGSLNLQPSEFAKLGLAVLLANYFSETRRASVEIPDILMVGLFTAVPFVLIAKQPDLGTSVGLLAVALGVTYLAGLRMRWLVILATLALLLAPVAWNYLLEPYQQERLVTFLDPARDAHGAGYQQIQAQITAVPLCTL